MYVLGGGGIRGVYMATRGYMGVIRRVYAGPGHPWGVPCGGRGP